MLYDVVTCEYGQFHNFKSQNLKLSVSNPKSKYVAYVSVLSRISNCQGLSRKNKHEILKTDRKKTAAGVGDPLPPHRCLSKYVCIYIYIYIYMYIYIYIYIERER